MGKCSVAVKETNGKLPIYKSPFYAASTAVPNIFPQLYMNVECVFFILFCRDALISERITNIELVWSVS